MPRAVCVWRGDTHTWSWQAAEGPRPRVAVGRRAGLGPAGRRPSRVARGACPVRIRWSPLRTCSASAYVGACALETRETTHDTRHSESADDFEFDPTVRPQYCLLSVLYSSHVSPQLYADRFVPYICTGTR